MLRHESSPGVRRSAEQGLRVRGCDRAGAQARAQAAHTARFEVASPARRAEPAPLCTGNLAAVRALPGADFAGLSTSPGASSKRWWLQLTPALNARYLWNSTLGVDTFEDAGAGGALRLSLSIHEDLRVATCHIATAFE